ncbi:MOSC domain-containing protein [Cohnella sp. AR92]|uniref:MOSC domain-containing protein n=1 Tax=Cohnella sp. AR92 TaxID=648716 RepID=UPI000F8DC7D4|nr:MOSC domain-containing protein [Cohnella sp. AR92]RUS46185.1 MOSC domain-containing protein [Cohnella sp. AR92]
MIIGSVMEMHRYPVKSFGGERLIDKVRIEPYGVEGDRWHAFVDETKTGWNSFVTARGIPAMLAYRAELLAAVEEGAVPEVAITAPDGRKLRWNEELLQDVQGLTSTKLSMRNYSKPREELKGVDDSPILIVTDRSIRKLEELWGKPLNPRRFRANLLVRLDREAPDEGEWIGKELSIGSVTLRIDKGCERCALITLDPDTQERDPSLLKVVNRELSLTFGVYASVVKPGFIETNDEIRLD